MLNQFAENDSLMERVSVRINSMDSGLAIDDMAVVMNGIVLPRTVLLPKVDTKSNMDQVY